MHACACPREQGARLDMGVERAGEEPRPGCGGGAGVRGHSQGGDRLLVVGQPRQHPPARQHVPHPAAQQAHMCRGLSLGFTQNCSQGSQASARPTARPTPCRAAGAHVTGLALGCSRVAARAHRHPPARQHVPHSAAQQAHMFRGCY